MWENLSKKQISEVLFWENLYYNETRGCLSKKERDLAEINIAHKITFPRYCKDLKLTVDSFNGDTVLDLGCGPHGGLIGFTNCKKYGVDDLINEYKLIGYPLDQYQIEYIHAPAEKLPFPDRFFTTIVCVNALDHMDNIQKVFSEMSRVLMNTGHILLQVMFHSKPRVGHPICLNTQQMLLLCSEYSLVVLECSFQRVGGGNKCDRDDVYFYKLFKLGESIK